MSELTLRTFRDFSNILYTVQEIICADEDFLKSVCEDFNADSLTLSWVTPNDIYIDGFEPNDFGLYVNFKRHRGLSGNIRMRIPDKLYEQAVEKMMAQAEA